VKKTPQTFGGVFRGKRVLVTGHTGFKGSWLCLWLRELGAEVAGFSNRIPTRPSHFHLLQLQGEVQDRRGDIRDATAVTQWFRKFRPEVVFHLAAQPLVRRSLLEPADTFAVNTLGMVNVLEALRVTPSVRSVVLATSDKVYRNMEWSRGYHEEDRLGGKDPYSASKGCAELVAYSYLQSFFRRPRPALALARAGNVIGGGDWAEDRIVPDAVRAWTRGAKVRVRHPESTRPWQHVLEPLSGYLWLAARLLASPAGLHGEAFNFGPPPRADHTVGELLQSLQNHWPGAAWVRDSGQAKGSREARLLKLSCRKARAQLHWLPSLSFRETAALTGEWYDCWHRKTTPPREASRQQIRAYTERARKAGIRWAKR